MLETYHSLVEFQFSSSENQNSGSHLLPCFSSKTEASGIVATSISPSWSCSASSLWLFRLYWQRVTNFTRIMAVHSQQLSFIWLPFLSFSSCVIPEKGKDQASRFLSLKDLILFPRLRPSQGDKESTWEMNSGMRDVSRPPCSLMMGLGHASISYSEGNDFLYPLRELVLNVAPERLSKPWSHHSSCNLTLMVSSAVRMPVPEW